MVLRSFAHCMRSKHGLVNSSRKHNQPQVFCRRLFSKSSAKLGLKVLGIETSCDDTGVAIVSCDRNILADALHNQAQIHLANGGILPPVAGYHHRANMEKVANEALSAAKLSMTDIDAVAATVKPGLSLSLEVGTKYGVFLSKRYQKPFIPIHHMEAHALTARLIDERVKFPFLVLLISGGHCLLALVQGVDSFLLLGKGLDNSPGEVLDKVHRRLKLRNIPELQNFSGGHAIEVMAEKATDRFEFPLQIRANSMVSCDFSFSGLLTNCFNIIATEEQKYGTSADGVIPSAPNLCAALQYAMTSHLCRRVEKAMIFVKGKQMIPSNNPSLVVSGGVAANKFIAKALNAVCDAHDYHLSVPPPHLCNDNGVMIAWNGVERLRENLGVLHWNNLDSVTISTKCPLGKDIRKDVANAGISGLKYVKLTGLI
ncbi:putative tRNA N6-adenosine threonylcarbamoyltransferase, mitochondrial [Frankliniella fusca]|uniref:N(6)-L-threonylcarbamoyladenine synthase n=1 Tax=Frankliniella fusca TaxID=407009 RepID=A0AAE1H3D4_9NEOP|nr:putative tRNA N6-adenosine threonylcarbamoyltransferase, mitochondrial [Frankliniella fusca]KAK3928158.1 putative tRNA N6-adenosine threonylcarbamoyltransferase, mitochondrial [Frankliniella fusca]